MASKRSPLAFEGAFGAQILTPATPRGLEDLIFYESFDITLPCNEVWEYGQAHHDVVRFPDHRLVHVVPGRDQSTQIRYFASKRLLEDEYNWEFSDADIGQVKFRTCTRSYVRLRSEFDPDSHSMGDLAEPVPAGLFQTDFLLARRDQKRIQDETLDSLFVIEQLTYISRCPISQVMFDLQTGNSKRSVTNLHYRGETVDGSLIEDLADDPADPYWGLQADATFRELDQLSFNWFAITLSMAIPSGGPLGDGNPAKTRIVERPTPIVGDLIFYETGVMPDLVPEYGTPHYDETAWPNHKLAFIRPASGDKTGLLYEFVYVADRPNQDSYNAEFSQADIGGTKFNAIQRTYVTPRAEFNPDSPTQGAEMATALSGAAGTYILAERKQGRSGDREIDNLYVIDVHTYVKRSTTSDVETPSNLRISIRKTSTLYYRGETISGTAVEALFADQDLAFWKPSDVARAGRQLTDAWFEIVDLEAGSASSESTQDAYNWEFGQADLGGQKFNSATRTLIIPRSSFDSALPAMGTVISNIPASEFTSYILAERQQSRLPNLELDLLFIIEKRVYVQRESFTEIKVESLRVVARKTTNLHYRAETVSALPIESLIVDTNNDYWKVQADGTQRAGQQLTYNWFQVITVILGSVEIEAVQNAYDWEHSKADLGGIRFNTLERAIVRLRTAYSATVPAAGTALTDVPAGMFTGMGYILLNRQTARTGDSPLDAAFIIERQTYIQRATMSDITTDRTLGVGVQELTTLYYRDELVVGTVGPITVQALFAAPENTYWGNQSAGEERSGRQLSDIWFAIIERSSREAALLAYKLKLPTSINLDLPDVLLGVTVKWNEAASDSVASSDWNGIAASQPDSDMNINLTGEETANCSSSASVQPDVNLEIRSYNGRGIPGISCFFFMKLTAGEVDEADFLTRVSDIIGSSVARWPIFRPELHSLICLGQKVGVEAQASGRAQNAYHGNALTGDGYASKETNQGTGVGIDYSTTNSVTRVPPTIHGDISIGDTTKTATTSAQASVGWIGSGSGEIIAGIMNEFPDMDSNTGVISKNAEGSVSPDFLPATNPSEIPSSGLFLVEMKVQPSEPNWVQCYAEVVDASYIA